MAGTFREFVRESLSNYLFSLLKNPDGGYPWRVLVLDTVTLKIVSSAMKMSELQARGISLVENLNLSREPLQLEAVYFITPNEDSVGRLSTDQGKGLYSAYHVFFSSTVPPPLLDKIKSNKNLVRKLKSLKEVGLEVSILDSQCFLTNQPNSLQILYNEKSDPSSNIYKAELHLAATRLATVFTTMNERPSIRYFKPNPGKVAATMGHRLQICESLARRLDAEINSISLPSFPKTPTCDCLILDRTMDAVAPVIHEWTYEAMVYDLFDLQGNICKNPVSQTEMILDEDDKLWTELRHMHIAEASYSVNEKFENFRKDNTVARIKGSGGSALSNTDIKNLIQSLPEYSDVLSKMDMHIDITRTLFKIVGDRKLKEIGELEQDLVYGEKHSKDIIGLLSDDPGLETKDKIRLLMCYLATHPDKLDTERRLQWQKLAKLNANEMDTMLNLEYLGISVTKKDGASLLNFVRKNKSKGTRKPKMGDQYAQQYALEKFQPELYEILEKLAANDLPKDMYPFVREEASSSSTSPVVGSARTNYAWTRKKNNAADPVKTRGRRVVIYVIGGISRSEMRVAHKLAPTLQRDFILGSTSTENSASFIDKLGGLARSTDDDLLDSTSGR